MSRDIQHYYAGRKEGSEEIIIHFIIDYDKKEAFISLWTPEELSSSPSSVKEGFGMVVSDEGRSLDGEDHSMGDKGDER